MSFKPFSNPNANANANANANRFLSGGAKPNRQTTFAPAATPAAPNAFSSLRSFISPISGEIPPPQAEPTAVPYDKNVDFPILTTTTKASASSSSSSSTSLSYRTAVMTSTAQQQAQQARIQKEIEKEHKAKEKAYDQLRRDAARSHDVKTALTAAASYDISDISESVIGRHAIE